jgi:hypothetical protein
MFLERRDKGMKLDSLKFLPHMTLVGSAQVLECECTDISEVAVPKPAIMFMGIIESTVSMCN